MRRSNTEVATGCVLAAAVGLLSIIGYVGFHRLRHTVSQVNHAATRVSEFNALQRAVAQETIAELAFARHPSVAARATLAQEAAQLTSTANRVGATSVIKLNRAPYSAVTLSAVQHEVDVESARAEAQLRTTRANQAAVLNRMTWRAPLVLVVTFIATALGWLMLTACMRRAAWRADHNELLAMRDPLTALGNRREFDARLAELMAAEEPDCAVLLIDLDGFKAINDTWGHERGDDVLRQVADRLRETVRSTDEVARIGGDEFVVLAQPSRHAEGLRTRLCNAIAQPVHLGDLLLHPSASIGLAHVGPGADREHVLKAADADLYAHKRSKTPRVMRV